MVIIPIIIGGLPITLIKKKTEIALNDICKLLIQAWVYGFIFMLAVMQLIAVPMIAKRVSFTSLLNLFCIISAICLLTGLYCWIRILINGKKVAQKIVKKVSYFTIAYGIIAFMFIGYQARICSKYQHSDDDDSRFVALELIAVERDEMLTRNPINGDPWYWNVGEVKKDYTSPWTMYVAIISKLTGIHPAILSHRMLPIFLIPLCYMAYILLGLHLFRDNWEKTFLFVIIISLVNIFGYTSTHTISSLLLLRIWQGKGLYAGLMIPAQLTLLWDTYEHPELIGNKLLLAITCEGASLLSGGGIVLSAMMIGTYGLAELLRHKNIKRTLAIWLTCTPCVVYSLCNLFWYQVFTRF